MSYLYEYILEIAKDPKYNRMVIRKQEIIAENETQWVYKYGDEFYIKKKKDKLFAKFINDLFFYKIPFYRVSYYTTEKGVKAENKVKKALQKLVDETCFITDIVKNTKIEFKEVG